MLNYKKIASLLPVSALLTVISISASAQQDESIYQRFAPIDLTGNWVSVITEDWHIRMITPPIGNFEGLPLTRRAQDVALAADFDQLRTDACQAYGAPRLLNEPGRLHISWENEATLRIDTDSGQQTRLLHFDNIPQASSPSRQGLSVAQWQYAGGFDPMQSILNPNTGGGRALARQPAREMMGGKLYVETTNLAPGLLRKNGVPYSGDTTMQEYYNTLREPDGTEWLIVTTVVRDPLNLLVDHISSNNFQREADASGWDPRPCSI